MFVLVFTGLCLAPLDGIKTCGFVFSYRATEQVSLLLNLVAYTLAAHIWVSILALSWLSEHGPLPLEEVCWVRNDFTSWIWVNIVDVSSHVQLPKAIIVCMSFEGRITTLSKCYICSNPVAPESRKNVVFPSIAPTDPWTNLWEYVSNLLQSFLSVIVLSNSSDGTHFMTNVFEDIFVTVH